MSAIRITNHNQLLGMTGPGGRRRGLRFGEEGWRGGIGSSIADSDSVPLLSIIWPTQAKRIAARPLACALRADKMRW
jgi:hypothetical protein